jgi:hypothetical protein
MLGRWEQQVNRHPRRGGNVVSLIAIYHQPANIAFVSAKEAGFRSQIIVSM